MSRKDNSPLRRALLPLTATAVAVGAFLGLPFVKALEAAQEMKIAPIKNLPRPSAGVNIIQPAFVNPSAQKLVAIAHDALLDDALAERIFQDPDSVAAQHGLSDHERLVLRNMTREQFQIARADAAGLRDQRLALVGARRLPASAADAQVIAEQMIVGRAILAAVGRSYLDAANAHACCPWSKSIELGVNPSRVFYDEVFAAPGRVNVIKPLNQVPRSN